MYLSSGIQHDVIVTWPTYCNVQQGFPLLSSEHLSEGACSLVPYVQCVLPMWPCNNELSITRKCTLLPLCSGGRGRGDRKMKFTFSARVYVCVYCASVHAHWLSTCECVCTHARTCTYTHAYVCVCVHMCECVCMPLRVCDYCMWMWMNLCTCEWMCLCQWYSPGRKKKESLSLHVCTCDVLFIHGWTGDMINMCIHVYMYTMYLPIHKVLQPLQCFGLPLLVLHDFLNVVHSYHPVRRVDQKIAV